MRKLSLRIIFAVIFVVGAGLFYFFRKSPRPIDTYGETQTEVLQDQESKNDKDSESVQQNLPSSDQTVGLASTDSSIGVSEKTRRLQTWLAAESKNLEQPHVDTKQKDLELKKMIENFSEEEKKMVLQVSLDTQRPANERILSTYMLVLDQSSSSLENLKDVATKALPDFGPVTAHSEAEIRRGQEMAVRYMAVDELAKRAPNSPEALESLKKLANSAESAEIRGYAQRVLKQIK